MICAHRSPDTREAIGTQAGSKIALDTAEQAGPLIDEGRVELNERRAGPNLRVSVRAAGHAADTDQGHAAMSQRIYLAQQFGRKGEQRSPTETAAFLGIAAAK